MLMLIMLSAQVPLFQLQVLLVALVKQAFKVIQNEYQLLIKISDQVPLIFYLIYFKLTSMEIVRLELTQLQYF